MSEAQSLGLSYEYRLIDLLHESVSGRSLSQIFDEVSSAGYDALNITFPFKQAALSLISEVSPEVEVLGATNLAIRSGDKWFAHNTDAAGFAFALAHSIPDGPRHRVVQFGAGGAGAATAYALLDWGVQELVIADLDLARADALASRFRSEFPNAILVGSDLDQARKYLASTGGVVNATPIGMHGHPGTPFDVARLNPEAWVADVVYRPTQTQTLRLAQEAGHRLVPGWLMALGQAYESLRLITGLEPDFVRMRNHFLKLLGEDSQLSRIRGI
jgi:shikimate dehydrogenase